ncbi:odorant receptor 131-2-like [Centroberyx gerrardi]|uniref:odorant receptor 131-2-like n=1 Tax=Centroberyx gerrardi TaxID=166262 RepID=UPI003AAF717D
MVVYRDTFIMAVSKNVIVVVLGISINYINATMIHTFNKQQIFKMNPRYILFIHLVINDMIQLTISISLFIFTYVFDTINVSLCCLLILPAIFTTQNTPLNVTFMAVECYIAVCLSVLPDLFILLATEPLTFFHARVYCARDNVFRSTYSLEKRDASHIIFLVLVWLTLFYTYFKILFAAKAANADATKARNTILLHGFQVLLCMITYVRPMLIQVLTYLFPAGVASANFAIFTINQILPRFVSPIVYGLRDMTFRKYLQRHLLCTGYNILEAPPGSALLKPAVHNQADDF